MNVNYSINRKQSSGSINRKQSSGSINRKQSSGEPLDLLGWTLIAVAIVAGLYLSLADPSAQSRSGTDPDNGSSLGRAIFCQPVGCVD